MQNNFEILFRSVRHLQDASKTDGKAAINLTKLKLFQQFYVMVSVEGSNFARLAISPEVYIIYNACEQ